jgi:hypothetical protein
VCKTRHTGSSQFRPIFRFIGLTLPPPFSSSRSALSLLPVTIEILRLIFLSYNFPPSCLYSFLSSFTLVCHCHSYPFISFISLPLPPAIHNLTVACNCVLHCVALCKISSHTNKYNSAANKS